MTKGPSPEPTSAAGLLDYPPGQKVSVAKGHAIAVRLGRRYTHFGEAARASSSLPAHKLSVVKQWITQHLAEPFSLATVARLVGISEFHFNRLFKSAVGMPPSQYQIKLRIES